MTRSGIDWLVKPVFVFTVDGDPHENPRYQKVIKVAIHHFVQHDLDALFIAANALDAVHLIELIERWHHEVEN